jgi:hypothetical protein
MRLYLVTDIEKSSKIGEGFLFPTHIKCDIIKEKKELGTL